MALFLRDKKDEERLKKLIEYGNEMFKTLSQHEYWKNLGEPVLHTLVGVYVNQYLGNQFNSCEIQNFDPNPYKITNFTNEGMITQNLPLATCSFTGSADNLSSTEIAKYVGLLVYFWAHPIKGGLYRAFLAFKNWYTKPTGGIPTDVFNTTEILSSMKNFFIMGQVFPAHSDKEFLTQFFKSIAVLFVSCLKPSCEFTEDIMDPIHKPQTATIYSNKLKTISYETLWKKLESAFNKNDFKETCFKPDAVQIWNASTIWDQMKFHI